MPLTAVLALTVSLSLWLGYEAWASARNHRAAVGAMLRDYRGMAARELSAWLDTGSKPGTVRGGTAAGAPRLLHSVKPRLT